MSEERSTGVSGVSRRRFPDTAGATGIALRLAGCGGRDSPTIRLTVDQESVDAEEAVVDALYDVGLIRIIVVMYRYLSTPGSASFGNNLQ